MNYNYDNIDDMFYDLMNLVYIKDITIYNKYFDNLDCTAFIEAISWKYPISYSVRDIIDAVCQDNSDVEDNKKEILFYMALIGAFDDLDIIDDFYNKTKFSKDDIRKIKSVYKDIKSLNINSDDSSFNSIKETIDDIVRMNKNF